MWNYLSFISYLNWKDKNDFNGIESYILQKLGDNDTGW